ncbi:hypothetical protein I4U23_001797 [Adineta vaga]|nr:hypothetical protein I4U23_001797 [Adineta vaga]
MPFILFIGNTLKLIYLSIINWFEEMSSTLRQWKNRLHCSNKQTMYQNQLSIDDQFKNVHLIIDNVLSENNFLRTRLDQIEERYERWINNEQIYLTKRIEHLENENRQLHELHLTYQMQNETCMRSITDLIMKILLVQQKRRRIQDLLEHCILPCHEHFTYQERRKERIEQCDENDSVHWRTKQQQQQQDDNRCTTNDQTTWLDQCLMNVDEHDQQTRNQSSEFSNQFSTLATVKSKSDKSSTGLTNKLYYLLSNEKSPRDNHRLPSVNIISVDDVNPIPRKQQQSSVTINRNKSTPPPPPQKQTRTTYSNHERLSTQTPNRTTSAVKNTSATCNSKPIRVQTAPVRPSPSPSSTTTTTTINRPRPSVPSTTTQKTVSSSSITTIKPSRPRYTLAKSSEPLRTVTPTATRSTVSKSTITHKPTSTIVKPCTTHITHQPARVSDLDVLIAQQQNQNKSKKPTVISTTPVVNNIKKPLFTKNTVKLVRPVRSQELKTFSEHLTPHIPTLVIPNEIIDQTNESLSTLTPPSLESIAEYQSNEKKDESIATSITRDFSEDSLNEHRHIQQFLEKNASVNTNNTLRDHSSRSDISPIIQIQTETSADSAYCNGSMEHEETNMSEGYFLLTDDKLGSRETQLSTKTSSVSQKSVVHRLVFPSRLGRMIFFRRVLSDSDIYQKNCSKDAEITHNVYHLDTIRNYSMEFYMLTTYASDSQLRAWIDCSDDELVNNVCHYDDSRFQLDDYEHDNQLKQISSSDSLMEEELDWYSELEILNLTSVNQQDKQETASSCSIQQQQHLSIRSSAGITSTSWAVPQNILHNHHSSPISSDHNNSILQEILNHSWTDHLPSPPFHIPSDDVRDEPSENDMTSSIITDGFQSDFYYLCPVTNTTTFSKNDPQTLSHDV